MTIKVQEIFGPTIQGEGTTIGRPTVFVRTGGCDYRCSWCDTPFAVLSEHRALWEPQTPAQVLARVRELSGPCLVTLSGGNPALQDCGPTVALLQAAGYEVAVETQGSIPAPWLDEVNELTLSPKPPSSGMETDWDKLGACVLLPDPTTTVITLKVVVADAADLDYAARVFEALGDAVHERVVQPCNLTNDPSQEFDGAALMEKCRWLADEVLKRGWRDVRVLPQLHTLLWGNQTGV